MSEKEPDNKKEPDKSQKINLSKSDISGQIVQSGRDLVQGQADRDLVQIGGDYIQYISKNSRSGNWGAVLIALIPPILFFYGIYAIGNNVVKQNLLQTKNEEIVNLKKQVEDRKNTSGEKIKEFERKVDLHENTINTKQKELDDQKNLNQQQEQKIQVLETRIKDLTTNNVLEIDPQPPGECIITIDNKLVDLMSKPDSFSLELMRVKPGTYTPIEHRLNSDGTGEEGWFKVNTEGKEGWIANDTWSIESKTSACP